MAEFVRKTALGGYKLVPGGNSDPECTHVILSREEYGELIAELHRAEADVVEANRAANRRIEAAQERIKQEKEKAQKAIDEIRGTLGKAEKENEYLRGLNENLLRIARERANADRKLKPKKGHTGYVVVSSSEKEYRYKVDRRHWDTVTLWETVLQSPYTVDYTEEQARKQTGELTEQNENGTWLIGRTGINASYDGEYEDMIETDGWTDQQKKEMNIMLKRRLRANYRTGYWEIIFMHTKPLGIIPSDMRVR